MYLVTTVAEDRMFTTRRESFRFARQAARNDGQATWKDALGIEPDIHFISEGKRVRMCTCTAELRLLRAIFGESHPKECGA
jgi:hypothetical protein